MKKTHLLLSGMLLALSLSACSNSAPTSPQPDPPQQTGIHLDNLRSGDRIKLPYTVKGQAKGPWYFEGQFTVLVRTALDEILISSQAKSQDTWMTDELVPFTATLPNRDLVDSQEAEIVLKKANPSGLPENNEEVVIPIILTP